MKLQEDVRLPIDEGAVAALLAAGGMQVRAILADHPSLAKSLGTFDPVSTAAIFGGLLTVPELQCNCCRLEALSHIAVAFGRGSRKPTKSTISAWFSEMSSGPCGRYEDPAEDAFTSLVTTPRGNFRIIQGTWESAAFYLQRIINVVEGMPAGGVWDELRESSYALLRLSEVVCESAGLPRYLFGNPFPESDLPNEIAAALPEYRRRVTFSDADLRRHDLPLETLAPFIFDPELRPTLPTATLTHSPLQQHPLLRRDGQWVLALPTAVSIAIRTLVVRSMIQMDLKQPLLEALAHEYTEFFSDTPPLNTKRGAPIRFQPTDNGVMASYAVEVDTGRFLHLIFVLDTLEGFEDSGFGGANPDPIAIGHDLDRWIDNCQASLFKEDERRDGVTLIIGCGIGRAAAHALRRNNRSNWRVAFLSAADAATLDSLRDIKALTLWRILDAQSLLATHGVQLLNVNGLPNLFAWVRSLEGHLVPHSQIPEEFGKGQQSRIVIDPAMIRGLRMEATSRLDKHAVKSVDGKWVDVLKSNESLFDEDHLLPMYLQRKWEPDRGLPMVYLTATRQWWCEIRHPRSYERWKIMHTWLPKIASVLDRELPSLPVGPLSIVVGFAGDGFRPEEGAVITKDEIQARIGVHVDTARREVSIETDESFEQGLATPTNISEAALVGATVSGFLTLAREPIAGRLSDLTQQIVCNDSGRDFQIFQGVRFRDFVRECLPEHTITVDAIDDASLRLGLGWKVRNRNDGPTIEGKVACTTYLNELVRSIEDDLCLQLKAFNRQALIEAALQNHEVAMNEQAAWRRTTASMLGLHGDKAAAMATITEHEFKINNALHASRTLIELAVCECPIEGGNLPGTLDFCRLMAALMQVSALGGWSDAIHLDAVRPSIRIAPLGDVQVDPHFFEHVVKPFGHATGEKMVDAAVSEYATHFEQPVPVGAIDGELDASFVRAWKDEHTFAPDDFRRVVDEIEDYGIKEQRAVFAIRRSELAGLLAGEIPDGPAIAQVLTTTARPAWREVPIGFKDRDRQPWRFRRHLSLLRRPIVQLDESEDPLLIVAPGLMRDAVVYSMIGYLEGSFPHEQIKSTTMKSWFGGAADRRGKKFTQEVCSRLQELGWSVEPEVAVSKILGMGFNVDYGDVDILAWNRSNGRILFAECKDLHFHKTPGEIAEQLRDFRGKTRDGKRDLLKKHLDRCSILAANADRVKAYVELDGAPVFENVVIFRFPVPMLFAWTELETAVRITIFDELHAI